ncbi:DUF1080 domain-containing protein [Labilibacter sediminis]|nr:DUF1080 domain-containing protein [Labilibacter sediminis]
MKNIKIYGLLFFIFCAIMVYVSVSNDSARGQEVSEHEWISLFDGKTLNGWKRYNADTTGTIWKVEEGAIHCSKPVNKNINGGKSLITLEHFKNFELELEWKIERGGNSGIFYHVIEDTKLSRAFASGPEYQIIDAENWKEPLSNNRKTAGCYDMFAANQKTELYPPGQWNSSRIKYYNGNVQHWLNGVKVLEFTEKSEEWYQNYKKSKWVDFPFWCSEKKGAIGLQFEGRPTWFKSIRIRHI